LRVVFSLPNDWSALYRGATRFQGDRTPEPIFTFDLYTFFQRQRFQFWVGKYQFFNKLEHTHVRLAAHNLFLFLGQLAMVKRSQRLSLSLVFNLVLALGKSTRACTHTTVGTPSITFIYLLKRKT
jgi:hypothetical protein